MIIFFAWVAWIWMLILIFGDVFRRHDISGWVKAAMDDLPDRHAVPRRARLPDRQRQGMAERRARDAQASQAQIDQYVASVAAGSGGAAGEIDKAKALLDSGAITQAEFEQLKAKALAT